MELQYRELENGIRLIQPVGKFDIGEDRFVESKFIIHCAGGQARVLLDLSKIKAITSSGSELLLWTAKEVASRGGKFVVVNPLPSVELALEQKGIRDWAVIYTDIEVATTFLLASKIS